jgi:malto-oligosyltrehalose synthase
MYNPVATYRIQFQKTYNFTDFEKIIPYLKKLGIKTVYASPVFESTSGSTHGYDVLNTNCINPEIGTEEQLKEISRQLKSDGIGWLQDIVPNHMAFHPSNPWLMDVLEKGPQSIYANYFDITWSGGFHKGRLMVPFLGAPIEEVIKNGELKISYTNNRFAFTYFDNIYPLNPRSYAYILDHETTRNLDAIKQLLEQMPGMKQVEDDKKYIEQWTEFCQQLTGLMKNDKVRSAIETRISEINKDKNQLQQIADDQAYRLCSWKETDSQINYRRFFTVNGLICLNIQDEEVFRAHHQYIKSLMDTGIFQGLRVDHIDGLYDPSTYLERLRELAGEEAYLVVEKILEPGEKLPRNWPIQGNTGYDFLSIVNNLLTQKDIEEAFTIFYEDMTSDFSSIDHQVAEKKRYILYEHMGGELENLYRLFIELNLADKKAFASVRKEDLKNAIGEFLIQCPVYRYYGNRLPLDGEEAGAVQQILNRVRRVDEDLTRAVGMLESTLLHRPHEWNEDYNRRALAFYQRCMQFTGPLMAKGVEDTLMYTYNRFIGHNEVGDSPESFGITPGEFHQLMQERQALWPFSINGTSTHDTKRGEDVRARLNVLTNLADEWIKQVQEWQQLNSKSKIKGNLDPTDEYLIYQTLVGAYPMNGQEEDDFGSRIQEYLQKALREAKRYSTGQNQMKIMKDLPKPLLYRYWIRPNHSGRAFRLFTRKLPTMASSILFLSSFLN